MRSDIHIPNEVLEVILKRLEPKNDLGTILAARAVDKTWNRLATALVHVAVSNNPRHMGEHPKNIRKRPGVLQCLTWRLARRPQLAGFIKELNLRAWEDDYRRPRKEGEEKMHELYSSAVKGTVLPQDLKRDLFGGLQEGTADAYLAFILAVCTQLERLEVATGMQVLGHLTRGVLLEQHSSLPSRTTESQEYDGPILGSLRHLKLGNSVYSTSVPDTLNLLSLPKLQRLEIAGLQDNHTHTDAEPIRTRRPVDLLLDNAITSAPGLGMLLSACEKPRSLTVRWRAGDWTKHLTNESIGEMLRAHGTGLEYLHVDTTAMYQWRLLEHEFEPPFGSFAGLEKLRTLVVSRNAFSTEDPAEILPGSLEELYVLGADQEGDEQHFNALMAHENIPRLKKVVCVPWLHSRYSEWFGEVAHKCIDYNGVKDLQMDNFSG